ncbi:conjugative transposon protein TraM [Flavisericum labens]|uniref:conjugative transposon protein TraM n=1 Tax=Flavisericum labens TaxID=3377112 RepID=UPI00387B960B
MKIEKNKIVFAVVLATVVIFLIAYSAMLMDGAGDGDENLEQVQVPELEAEQKEYDSKLEAIDDLKEVRQTNAPSIYDESLLDSTGTYDPDLPIKRKRHIVDSIYRANRISYSENTYSKTIPSSTDRKPKKDRDTVVKTDAKVGAKEMGLEHQLFFASAPVKNPILDLRHTDSVIHVTVDGDQTVSTNHRLRMRLAKDAKIGNKVVPKNTPIYGFISFQPNRAMIRIENIGHHPIKLKAFDLQDGTEGIYVENSFRAEAGREIVEDIVDDINVVGLPQVGGIKKVFQRNNRTVKVTVVNNYRLLLKPEP